MLKKDKKMLKCTMLAVAVFAVSNALAIPSFAEENNQAIRPYVGTYAGTHTYQGNTFGVIGATIGVDTFVSDDVLIGLELDARRFQINPSFSELFFAGRIGYQFEDMALLYLRAGPGTFDFSQAIYTIGGGAEVSLTDHVSLRGQVEGIGAVGSAIDTTALTLGITGNF